jgi:hypothetical protein
MLAAILSIISALLAVLAWNRLAASRAIPSAKSPDDLTPTAAMAAQVTGRGLAFALLAASLVASAFGVAREYSSGMDWVVLFIPYLLIVIYFQMLSRSRLALLIIAALLMGSLFLVSSAILGGMAWGGFPAVLAALLTFIVLTTRELEFRTPVPDDTSSDPHVHLIHRRALAWLSVAFFMFGVVAFWPWLGKIYGNAYFWVMAIGVLVPILYLWGRLRQPRRQNSYIALLRFNRIIPYFGLVLLVAIALG